MRMSKVSHIGGNVPFDFGQFFKRYMKSKAMHMARAEIRAVDIRHFVHAENVADGTDTIWRALTPIDSFHVPASLIRLVDSFHRKQVI